MSTLAGVALVVAGVVGLALMDRELFPEAEDSPLYEATLRAAYSRFESQDGQVAALPPSDVQNAAPPAAAVADALRQLQAAQAGNFPDQQQYPPELLERLRQASVEQGLQRPGAGVAGVAPGHEGHQHGPVAAGASAEATHDHQHPALVAGEQLFAQGRHEEALAEFRKAAVALAGCTQVHHRLGDVLALLSRPDEALGEYAQVLASDPDYTCAHTHVGDLLLEQGRADEAEAAFSLAEDGYRQKLQLGGSHTTSARYHLAKFFLDHERRIDEAVELARAAVDDQPEQPTFLLLLSRCYEAVGDTDRAQATAARAAELASRHGHTGAAHAHTPAAASPGNNEPP